MSKTVFFISFFSFLISLPVSLELGYVYLTPRRGNRECNGRGGRAWDRNLAPNTKRKNAGWVWQNHFWLTSRHATYSPPHPFLTKEWHFFFGTNGGFCKHIRQIPNSNFKEVGARRGMKPTTTNNKNSHREFTAYIFQLVAFRGNFN